MAFGVELGTGLEDFEIFSDVVFVMDIIVCFRTTFVDPVSGDIIEDSGKMKDWYLRGASRSTPRTHARTFCRTIVSTRAFYDGLLRQKARNED